MQPTVENARTIRLVVRARSGDDIACRELFKACSGTIERFKKASASRVLPNVGDIEEVCLRGFERAQETYTFNPSGDSFQSYFATVTKNLIRDRSRLHKEAVSLDSEVQHDPVDAEFSSEAHGRINIDAIVAQLSTRDKVLVRKILTAEDVESTLEAIKRDYGKRRWALAVKRLAAQIGPILN